MTFTNYSTVMMLFNSDIRAIKVSYETEQQNGKRALYVFKTLDKSIKVGDYVVITTDTRHGLTVCKVEEVDVALDIDDRTEIKWIVDRVNTAPYHEVLKREKKFVDDMKRAQILEKQTALKASVEAMYKNAGIEVQLPQLTAYTDKTSSDDGIHVSVVESEADNV